MKFAPVAALAMAAFLAGVSSSAAHHSFAATYFEDQNVTIEGEILQFVYRNPHSFVHLTVKEKDGTTSKYTVEWGGTGQLGAQGVGKDTLKVGDAVVIVGRPSRVRGEYRALMVRLTRPSDGFSWGGRAGQVVD